MKPVSITARAPASVANICCGFDVLAFALADPFDEVTVSFNDHHEVCITDIIGNDQLSKAADKNIVGIVATTFLKQIQSKQGVDMQLNKHMAIGTGLGSSAASAVATAVALNALFDNPLSQTELLEVALAGEEAMSGTRHADNVAASLFGGIVLVQSVSPLTVYPIPNQCALTAVVIYPHIEILTQAARASLKQTVPTPQVVQQTANIASLILALTTGQTALLPSALQDVIFEPQRAASIPMNDAIKEAAIANGALGCGISGSGPSMFALCHSIEHAKQVGDSLQTICSTFDVNSHCFYSPLTASGAMVIT